MISPYSITLCHSIAQSALALLVQSSLILLLGLLLGALLRRHGPQAQSLIYRATLATVALTGIASLIFSSHVQPIWRISLPTRAATISAQPSTSPQADTPMSLPAALPRSGQLPPMPVTGGKTATTTQALILASPTPTESGNRWYVAAVLVWSVGAACLLFWFIIGQIHLLLLRRKSDPLNGAAADMLHKLHPEGAVTLLASPQVRSPFLAGIWHPAIYLPASYEQDFTEEELRMVLAHEVGHWQNRDNAWLLFARAICAALWIQPMLWMLASRLVHTSEENCDISALTMGCSARSYADCLLSFAERFRPTQLEYCAGNGVVPFRSSLGQRIRMILNSPRRTPPPRWLYSMIAVSMGFSIVLGLRLISGANDSNPSARVVRQYIADCEAGNLVQAYNLLSPRTRYYIAYADFANRGTVILGPRYHYSPLQAIYSLFAEPNLSADIRYEVVGIDSKRPYNVLVRTYQPGAAKRNVITVSIATVLNPKTGNPQLDFVQSEQPLAHDIVQKLDARKEQLECFSNLKQIELALMHYVQNHGYHFPDAERWVNEIAPYIKDASIFHDPASRADSKYSYAFNRNLSGLPLSKLTKNTPESVVMVFDSTKSTKNASDTGQSLPSPGRHSGGNDFLFADGHVKWLRGGQSLFGISDNLPAKTTSHRSVGVSHNTTLRQANSAEGQMAKINHTKAKTNSASNKQEEALLHRRNVLAKRYQVAQREFVLALQNIQLHPAPPPLPKAYKDNISDPIQSKVDYAKSVHQHNTEIAAYSDANKKDSIAKQKLQKIERELIAVNKRYLALTGGQ